MPSLKPIQADARESGFHVRAAADTVQVEVPCGAKLAVLVFSREQVDTLQRALSAARTTTPKGA